MPSVRELYELWDGESYPALDAELGRSLDPRGRDWLFDFFGSLGPRPGQLVVDVGARDASHTIRLVRKHGLRAVALDPMPFHVARARETVEESGVDIELVEAGIESMPLADASADWIWCRDVVVHVDVERGLAECARVLRPGGRMVAYVTLATELLEPREAAQLARAAALATLDSRAVEAAAANAGLELAEKVVLRSEWRERMLEDGEWDANDQLLRLSRLNRRKDELTADFGADAVEAYEGGRLWAVYSLLGKLCPTVYVWERHG